jgi:hypothetical protein
MIEHICEFCDYNTTKKINFDRHILTQKHKNNLKKIQNIDDKKYNDVNINDNINNNINNSVLITKIDDLAKQNEELRDKIERLQQASNRNTNTIVKEARSIKKSILTILNTNFKDTPSIEYIQEDEFKKELEIEYKCKLDDPNSKLFMKIFTDYENKKIIQTLSNLILKFVKKEDQKNQSVFNIDSARGNYATKIEDIWHNDKSGLQLKKYTLDVIIKYMINVLNIFRLKLIEVRNENIKSPSESRSDYLMKYQALLLEVNAYLTNVNTHKKVILFMCPELRVDQKLLDS